MSACQESPRDPREAGQGCFQTTQWSVVLAANDTNSELASASLARLCQDYWYPLYVYIRRRGHTPEDAQDLVQGFFERVLEKKYLQDADQDRGRFRTFLLTVLQRYLANEHDRANRQKRGGGMEILSLNKEETENRYLLEPSDGMTPEKALDREWAKTLLNRVLNQLKREYISAGKADLFEALEVFLSGYKSQISYSKIGEKLGLKEGTVKVTVHRLRQRYRELLRNEIANTVATPDAINEEIRHLFAAVS